MEFLAALADPRMARAIEEVRAMRISMHPSISCIDETPSVIDDFKTELEIAARLVEAEAYINNARNGVEGIESVETELAEKGREELLHKFGETSLSGKYPGHRIRGPDGQAEIWLKPDAQPVCRPPYFMPGERREVLRKLVSDAVA